MTIDDYIYQELHELFVRLAVKLAENTDDPDLAAAIPFETMKAENYMRAAWNRFMEGEK